MQSNPNNLQLALLFIGSPIAMLLTLKAYQVWLNYKDEQRRKLKWHRKIATRRMSERGHITGDFLRGLAEVCILILLLASVLGWMFHKGH
jgi:hypothetical protein